jgi:DNA-binding transcriptional ArsR family regulator
LTLPEKYQSVVESPAMVQILGLLQSQGRTMSKISEELNKSRASVSRTLQSLKRIGLLEAKKNPKDGRSTIFSIRKKDLVQEILAEVVSSQNRPRAFRAIPFAMIDLQRLVEEVLRTKLESWKVTRTRPPRPYDIILERLNPPLTVGLELKLGGEQFERRLYQTIGEIVAVKEPAGMVVLAVFGSVNKRAMSVADERLSSLMGAQGSVAKVLWLDRGPLSVDRAYVDEKVVSRVLEWAEEVPRSRSR